MDENYNHYSNRAFYYFRLAGVLITAITAVSLFVFPYYIRSVNTTALPTRAATAWYVSPAGNAGGDGSISRPWDLQTALNHPSAIKSGDTIYLRGGKYGSTTTTFKSKLNGTTNSYITVQPYLKEAVRIEGGLSIEGTWTIFRDFEVFNSSTKRTTNYPGSFPPDIDTPVGFNVLAGNNKIINNIIHDTGSAFGVWQQAPDVELYGNIVFNNGWQGPDRGHGHGFYIQNETGRKTIDNNMSLNNFGEALQLFGTNGPVKAIDVDGFVALNGQHVVSGGGGTEDININRFYGYGRINEIVKYGSVYNTDPNTKSVSIQNSVVALDGGQYGVFTGGYFYGKAVVRNNLFYSSSQTTTISIISPNKWSTFDWDYNKYFFRNTARLPFGIYWEDSSGTNKGEFVTYSEWKSRSGLDSNSTFSTGTPGTPNIYILPNKYESKRGHIVIYNWDNRGSVSVDVSALGLRTGDVYSIRNAQNFYNDQPLTGVYNGTPITIDMSANRWTTSNPTGYTPILYTSTFPQFGAFLITAQGSAVSPTPTVITPTPTRTPSPTIRPTNTPTLVSVKPGDANGDGRVDLLDYVFWLGHFGQTTSNGPRDGDFNNDAKVDLLDYVIWLSNYGK